MRGVVGHDVRAHCCCALRGGLLTLDDGFLWDDIINMLWLLGSARLAAGLWRIRWRLGAQHAVAVYLLSVGRNLQP